MCIMKFYVWHTNEILMNIVNEIVLHFCVKVFTEKNKVMEKGRNMSPYPSVSSWLLPYTFLYTERKRFLM